ncbi:chloramphenicol phosphotransferase [Nordella sp. HKS 07]|uniref:chloramphenicol phosphotransferase CPT family protein n=1 Tax=Nordella sp. HKS 07 TaxID=2712222 RepID=UPI0013E11ABA|nr:chloramphenicol phosphotransferase [Nordella sp. HKS 07]QIG50987.1 chloramphenicol phosphotransferase [Nordella sp. HKS 07]
MSHIIVLNGVGSVGKSSIARALQEITTLPFLHVSMDSFLDMLPAAYWDHPDGFTFETILQEGSPVVVIKSGPVAMKALRGMRHAMAAMAVEGNNLIIDDVMLAPSAAEYRVVFKGFDVSYVGIFAPLAVLEQRERDREDRMIGLARWQYDRVHHGLDYDLTIDTSRETPAQCAFKIKEAFGL